MRTATGIGMNTIASGRGILVTTAVTLVRNLLAVQEKERINRCLGSWDDFETRSLTMDLPDQIGYGAHILVHSGEPYMTGNLDG